MKPPALFSRIKKTYQAYGGARRKLIARSNEALSASKRAIFALQRGDKATAKKLLSEASKLFATSEAGFKTFPHLKHEGSHAAALEEYAEALLFQMYVEKGVLGQLEARVSDPKVYIAGLSDATGEIVRYTLRQITEGKTDEVKHARDTVEMVIEFMMSLDLTGYLRTKFDQAKKNLRKLEEMMYDLSIRE